MIIIGGATASGKTKLAACLAKHLDTCLISADSMQVYKGMDIGTAKETDQELGVKQYCVDIVEPIKRFTVVDYREYAKKAVDEVKIGGKIPIVVGGTGFYINSLLYDSMDYGVDEDLQLRNSLAQRLEEEGIEPLFQQLVKLDPVSGQRIHINNHRKVLRALEVTLKLKKPYSEVNQKPEIISRHKMIILLPKRHILNQNIQKRVDIMLESGLEKEVKSLLEDGLSFEMQSMQGIGYKEWQDYFDGKKDVNWVSEEIKKNTRNYAKRQQTWFKNQYKNAVVYDDYESIEQIVDNVLKEVL